MVPEVVEAHREFCRQTLPYAIRNIIRSDDSLVGKVQRLSSPRPVKLPAAFVVTDKKD